MKTCVRCNQEKELSAVSTLLVHFVCDDCRNDKSGWEFNGQRLQDMEYQLPESKQTSEEKGLYNDTNLFS